MRFLAIIFVALTVVGCTSTPARKPAQHDSGTAPPGSEKHCASQERLVNEGLRQNLPFDQTAKDRLGDPALDVILLGVEHQNFTDVIYPRLLRSARLKNPRLDCYLVESNIDDSYPTAKRAFELLNDGDSSLLTAENTGYDVGTLEEWIRIRKMGFKIYFVDEPGNLTDSDLKDPERVQAWAFARNRIMAEKISRLHKVGLCKTSFYPVGAFHLSDPDSNATVTSQLRATGLRVENFLLTIAGRNSASSENVGASWVNPSWTWLTGPVQSVEELSKKKVCSQPSRLPTESFAFDVPVTTAPVVYMHHEKEFMLQYRDFKSVFVYRCKENDGCADFNRRIDDATHY